MSLEHLVDHEHRLVTISGNGDLLESAVDSAGRLLSDHSLGRDYSLLFIIDQAPPIEGDSLMQLVELLKLVMRRFEGRLAIAAPGVGQQTPATLIAMLADDGQSRVQVFESETEARRWVAPSR